MKERYIWLFPYITGWYIWLPMGLAGVFGYEAKIVARELVVFLFKIAGLFTTAAIITGTIVGILDILGLYRLFW